MVWICSENGGEQITKTSYDMLSYKDKEAKRQIKNYVDGWNSQNGIKNREEDQKQKMATEENWTNLNGYRKIKH